MAAELTLDVVEALGSLELHRTTDLHCARPQSLLDIYSAALDTVAFPVCAVDADRRLLFANRAAQTCIGERRWLSTRDGRICLAVQGSQVCRFGTAMQLLRSGHGSTLFLSDAGKVSQAMLTIVPILRSCTQDCASVPPASAASDCLGLVWLTTGETDSRAIGRMAELFLLTPAEQVLLTRLADGEGVREAAAGLGVSIHTARNQLKSILGKTGSHSQVQLLTLVTRVASISLPEPEWRPTSPLKTAL